MGGVTLPSHANSKNAVHVKYLVGGYSEVYSSALEFHTTVVTQKFAEITILLLQCKSSKNGKQLVGRLINSFHHVMCSVLFIA